MLRRLVRALAASWIVASATMCVVATAGAADYPTHTVRIVVGFPPGGGNDVLARIFAQKLQAALGATFIVDNRPGASGILAANLVKQAAPDGYTLFVAPSSGMSMNPVLFRQLSYDPLKDFAPISLLGRFPLFLSVPPSSGSKTVADLVATAKAEPGRIAYSSAASSFQLATELFAQEAGIVLNHVPYKGSGPAVEAVVGEQVQLTFGDSSAVVPLIRSGKLRALGVSTLARSPALPDVEPIAAQGVPGFDIALWSGLFAPAGTPPAIVDALHAAVVRILALPDVREQMIGLGIEPVSSTPAELSRRIAGEIAQFRDVVAKARIELQ